MFNEERQLIDLHLACLDKVCFLKDQLDRVVYYLEKSNLDEDGKLGLLGAKNGQSVVTEYLEKEINGIK